MKKIHNEIISEKQGFRMGVLENITLGMVLIPYIAINIAGKYHMLALFLGLIFLAVYGKWIIGMAREFPRGIVNEMKQQKFLGKLVAGLYTLRFVMRASLVMLFFSQVIREYMLRSYSVLAVVIPFFLVCIYGAKGTLERRGRLVELLFLWMVIPIILAGVFSVNAIDINNIFSVSGGKAGDGIAAAFSNSFYGAYVILLLLSTVELSIFYHSRQQKNWAGMYVKVFMWTSFAIIVAYVYIVGILGVNFVGSKNTASLNVIETATLPGGLIERFDYPVLAFWIIGVFVLCSGYIFCAKELAEVIVGKRKNYILVIALVILELILWSNDVMRGAMAVYMLRVDLAISTVLPLALLVKKKRSYVKNSEGVKRLVWSAFLIVALCLIGITNDYGSLDLLDDSVKLSGRQNSIEGKDYVVKLDIKDNKKNKLYTFEVAELMEYSGNLGEEVECSKYSCYGNSLTEAMEIYYKEMKRFPDLGHIKEIIIEENKEEYSDTAAWYEFSGIKNPFIDSIVIEMSRMPQLSKSVETIIIHGEEQEKNILRNLIKQAYNREGL